MEDRGEIRALEAELAALEKDKKTKLDANKRAEAQLLEPRILQLSEQLKALKEGLDRFVREHKERREDAELRDTVRDRVMADAKIPAAEKDRRFFDELRKAQEELAEKRLRARVDAGDESARPELDKLLAERANLAKNADFRLFNNDTRKKFDERFDAQVRAGERQSWEEMYDWRDTWQKALKEWYAKAIADPAEKAKKIAEADLAIADNRFNWDMAREREATENDVRKYGIEWELQPMPWTADSETSFNRAVAGLEADIAKMTKELETAGADRKKMLERLIADQTAEIERLRGRKDFAQAYHQELQRQKGPDARERMLDFRQEWFKARVDAIANPTVKAELQAKLTALQALIREVAEEKLKGRTIDDIEREDYLFKRMKRRFEGEIRVLNENLARWAERVATLPDGNDEKKGLDARIAEQKEKRNGLENRLADLLVDHDWKVARMRKEQELRENPERFTEMLKFEAEWLTKKIKELKAVATNLEAPAKADPAAQRQLEITNRIKTDKEKELVAVEARLAERKRVVILREELRAIDDDIRAGKISFAVAHLRREKAMLDSRIKLLMGEDGELAKKDPRVLDEIKELRRKPFNMDGFPYVAVDYPRFVEAFLVPWQKKIDALQAKLKAFDEKNRGKLLDKKVRVDRTKIEEEMIALRLERLADMKRAIDRGDVEIVVPALPPLTIDVSAETTDNIREASDLIQRDTVSVAGEFAMNLSAEEKAEIDKFVEQIKKLDQKGVIPELIEAGRWWNQERWYKEFAALFAARPSLLGADRQPIRLRILKEWNEDFAAQVRVFSDRKFATFRFRYRKVFGGEMVEPIMSDSWREINERNGSDLHLRLPLPTLMGMFQERVAIEEINTFQNKLTQLRLQRLNNWLFNYNDPVSGRVLPRAYLNLMAQLYLGLYTAEWAQLRSMTWATPGGEEAIAARIQFVEGRVNELQQFAALSDQVLLMRLSSAAPIGIAGVPTPKGKGRGKDAVAVPLGGDAVSNFLSVLNNYYESRNRLDASLDVTYIRMADEYLRLASTAKRTPWQDARMVALENELQHFHEGKAPYHYNRRSSINVLTWYHQHSTWEEKDWVERAEQEARSLLDGLYKMAQEMNGLNPQNFQRYFQKLAEPVGQESGDSVRAIFQQRIQNIVSSIEDPILNQARINEDVKNLTKVLERLYPLYSEKARSQMARAYIEDFLITRPEEMERGITEKHLKFLDTYKAFYDGGGFDAFKRLYGHEYGDLFNPAYLDRFLQGREDTFGEKEIADLKIIIQNQIGSFPPEDAIRLRIILSQIDMLENNPQAYLRSLYFGWKLSFAGAWDGGSNIGRLQAKTRLYAQMGNAALAVKKRRLYGELAGLVGTYIRRDVQTTLVAQIREAENIGIDTVRDVPDGRGGTKRGLLTKIEHDIRLRRNLEIFIFGPRVVDGKMQKGAPAKKLNLNFEDDLALINTLEKGMAERGISVDALSEILEKVAGSYGYDAKEKRVTYPFQEAIWELNERLNGRKEPRPFPRQGWAKEDKARGITVTAKERREFVATVLSEAELYAQLGKEEYTKRRLELLTFLRANPNAVEQTLVTVHSTVRDVKNAFRADGKPITSKVPKTYAEASGLERGMVRAILTAAARPGGNLDRELKRMRLLTIIVQNKDHLRRTIDQAQEFYERIFGPTTKLPLITPETILQDNLAFSRYADFLLMGIETWELPAPDAPQADIDRAVNGAVRRWDDNIRKLNEHLAKFPLDREIMINLAFLEVMNQKGWVPIGEFDYDTGTYKVERDQKEFEKFRRQLAKMNFDVYIAYIKQLIKEGLPDVVPAPAVPAPGVPVFDGIFPEAPGIEAKDAARLKALPIPAAQPFPDGFLLDQQYARLQWPVYVQREGKDNIVVKGYGRVNARGLIPGVVNVWSDTGKNYFPFHVAPRGKVKELNAFLGNEPGKASQFSPADIRRLTLLLWDSRNKLRLNEKAEQIVWRKSLDDGTTWFDALVLRADGTLLIGNQEVSLGLAGPQYQRMTVQNVKTARVDDDGKLHIAMTVLGDRFTGDIYLTATFDEVTGQTKVNIKSSYKVLRTGNAKKDEAIDQVLTVPVHQLTALRLGATPREHETVTYHTVAGRVDRPVVEPGVGAVGDSRRFGEVNETYAATLKRRDGTLIQVVESPVARQLDQNPIEFRLESGNRTQMPGNIPVQVTVGTPVQKKIEPGSVLLSDITITSIPKPKAAKAEDVKAPDIAAPAGWPVAAKKAGAPVSEVARAMRERETRTNALTERFFNRKGLTAADDWYYALFFRLGPADKKPDEKVWKSFMSYFRADAAEQEKVRRELMESKDPVTSEIAARFRAFMSRAAEIEEKDLDKAFDEYQKQNAPQIEALSDKEKRRLMIASIIFNDLAFQGLSAEFVVGLREDDALKALKEAMKKDKMALFSQVMRPEEELKDARLRASVPADGKIWIRLGGVRYEAGLKVAGKISLRTEDGAAVLGPFDNRPGTVITVGEDKYDVVSADDKEIKLRRQGPVQLSDLVNFETEAGRQGLALLDRMIEYYEGRLLKSPILQGKLSSKVKAATAKGKGVSDWNDWLKSTIDGLILIRALERPAGAFLQPRDQKTLVQYLDSVREEQIAAMRFLHAIPDEMRPAYMAANFEGLLQGAVQLASLDDRFVQGLDVYRENIEREIGQGMDELQAALDQIGAQTDVRLTNVLLREQIASLTQEVEGKRIGGEALLNRLIDVLDTLAKREESNVAARKAREHLADIRQEILLSHVGVSGDFGSNITALMTQLREDLAGIDVNLDSDLTDTLLRPLLAALHVEVDGVPAPELWQSLAGKVQGMVYTQQVINLAGDMGRRAAERLVAEQIGQETDLANADRDARTRHSAEIDELRKTVAERSNEDVSLVVSLPVTDEDPLRGFAMLHLGKMLRDKTEPLPPAGVEIFLADGSNEDEVYTFDSEAMTLTFNLGKALHEMPVLEFYGAYRKAVRTVTATFQRNQTEFDRLARVVTESSGGTLKVEASPRILADEEITDYAVAQIIEVLQKEDLPPAGTTIHVDNQPFKESPFSFTASASTITLNLAQIDGSPSEKITGYETASHPDMSGAYREAVEAASLGKETLVPAEQKLTAEQQEQLKAALDSKEAISRVSLLIALGLATSSLKPVNEQPGLLVIQGDKYYSGKNPDTLLDHVKGLLDSMTSQVIAISLDPANIADDVERQALVAKLNELRSLEAYKGRLYVMEASLANTFAQLEPLAVQMNLKDQDSMQFSLRLDKRVPDQYLKSALLNLSRYAAGRVVVLGDEDLAAIAGTPTVITLEHLIRALEIEQAAEQQLGRAA